jgi:hypothetical protein
MNSLMADEKQDDVKTTSRIQMFFLLT